MEHPTTWPPSTMMQQPGRQEGAQSPALPAPSKLQPTFVPAQVMTPGGRILPEKLRLADGGRITDPQHRQRTAMAEQMPQPVMPTVARADAMAAPGGHALAHHGHIFYDMSVATPIATEWIVEKPVVSVETIEQPPILPAPHDTMMNAGEGYTIKSAQSGDVLASSELPAVPPSLAPNISV